MALPEAASSASTIIGFISFAASVGTLIRVTWDELSTLVSAPAQIHFALSNLKEALWEERRAIRSTERYIRKTKRQRRHSGSSAKAAKQYMEKSGLSDDPLRDFDYKVYRETVQALCERFSDVERPFLRSNLVAGPSKSSSRWDDVETATRYEEDGFQNDYCDLSLALRFKWLKTKSSVTDMWTALGHLQQRRSVIEMSTTLYELRNMQQSMRDLKLIPDPSDSTDSDRDAESRVHVRRSSRRDSHAHHRTR